MLPCCLAMTILFGGFYLLLKTVKQGALRLAGKTEQRSAEWQRPRISVTASTERQTDC